MLEWFQKDSTSQGEETQQSRRKKQNKYLPTSDFNYAYDLEGWNDQKKYIYCIIPIWKCAELSEINELMKTKRPKCMLYDPESPYQQLILEVWEN